MRLPPAIIEHVEQVLAEVLRFTAPADNTLSHYFREHPRLGGRDRGIVAEAVYGLLRNKLLFASFAESGSGRMMRRLALLALADCAGVDSLGGLSETEHAWLTHALATDRTLLPVALQINMPDWLCERLRAQCGDAGLLALAQALNQPAGLDLRINTMKADRDAVQAELAVAGIQAELTPYAPDGLRIATKPALQNLPLFKNGTIEVQDEGSQLLAKLVGARRGEMVVDFCAGAGGKTLALGADMRNTGRLYAFDVSDKRLAKLKPRLARSGLSNVHPVVIAHERDAKIKRLAGKIDRVLVDAPCSGLGTLRRNPDMKWRQNPEGIAELTAKQTAILDSAQRLVRPGGRLVYATCSLLDEENVRIAEQFAAAHPEFELLPVGALLAEMKIDLAMGDYLSLSPQQHNTDGFFAAIYTRKK